MLKQNTKEYRVKAKAWNDDQAVRLADIKEKYEKRLKAIDNSNSAQSDKASKKANAKKLRDKREYVAKLSFEDMQAGERETAERQSKRSDRDARLDEFKTGCKDYKKAWEEMSQPDKRTWYKHQMDNMPQTNSEFNLRIINNTKCFTEYESRIMFMLSLVLPRITQKKKLLAKFESMLKDAVSPKPKSKVLNTYAKYVKAEYKNTKADEPQKKMKELGKTWKKLSQVQKDEYE